MQRITLKCPNCGHEIIDIYETKVNVSTSLNKMKNVTQVNCPKCGYEIFDAYEIELVPPQVAYKHLPTGVPLPDKTERPSSTTNSIIEEINNMPCLRSGIKKIEVSNTEMSLYVKDKKLLYTEIMQSLLEIAKKYKQRLYFDIEQRYFYIYVPREPPQDEGPVPVEILA